MKALTIIVQVLLGLMFVVFGLNGFLQFIPMSPPPADTPAGQFFVATSRTGFMQAISGFQVLGGLLLLIGFAPAGLTILCPIIVNIVLFHAFMEPRGMPMAIVVALLAVFLVWRYWPHFAPLVRRPVSKSSAPSPPP